MHLTTCGTHLCLNVCEDSFGQFTLSFSLSFAVAAQWELSQIRSLPLWLFGLMWELPGALIGFSTGHLQLAPHYNTDFALKHNQSRGVTLQKTKRQKFWNNSSPMNRIQESVQTINMIVDQQFAFLWITPWCCYSSMFILIIVNITCK